jgi:hypothetical protein
MVDTSTREKRIAYVNKLRFDNAVSDHADKLKETWANSDGPRRPLSRAYELLHPVNVRQAIVEWCLDFARANYPGTISNPTDEERVHQLYREGKFCLPELPSLRQFLNSWATAALRQGALALWALEKGAIATGKRRQVASDRLQILQLDFKQCTGSVNGETIIYGIEVEVADAGKPKKTDGRRISLADLRRWYSEIHIPACPHGSSRDQDFAEARKYFGHDIPRQVIWDLRAELAPKTWTAKGLRRRPKLSD